MRKVVFVVARLPQTDEGEVSVSAELAVGRQLAGQAGSTSPLALRAAASRSTAYSAEGAVEERLPELGAPRDFAVGFGAEVEEQARAYTVFEEGWTGLLKGMHRPPAGSNA